MILIIIAKDYEQFRRFIDRHFFYSSRGGLLYNFVCITSMEDVEKINGLERNQLMMYIGGDHGIVYHLQKTKLHNLIELKEI